MSECMNFSATGIRHPAGAWSGKRRPLPEDQPLRAALRVSLLVAGCAMPLITMFFAKYPGTVERIYTDLIGQIIARTLTRISGFLPFSVIELAVTALGLFVLLLAMRGLIQVAGRKRHPLNATLCGALWLGAAAGVVTITGYLAWGFNFARADLVTRLHWSDFAQQAGSTEELARNCANLIDITNRNFEAAIGSRDPGKPSTPPNSVAAMDASIEEAYTRVAERLNLHPSFGVNRGRAKPVLASFAMSMVLVAGFYSPWTGEANYNAELPLHELPQAIAHEKAHQRGVPNEDEANFFSFVACIYARDPYVRYSGFLFAQRQLLFELRRSDPDRVQDLVARRDPGIQRDVEESREFAVRHSGTISDMNAAVIDAYLKANRAPGGIQSYAMSSRLILIYARAVEDAFR